MSAIVLMNRVTALERQLAELRAEVDALKAQLPKRQTITLPKKD